MKIFQKNLDVLDVSTSVENVTRMEGSGFLRNLFPRISQLPTSKWKFNFKTKYELYLTNLFIPNFYFIVTCCYSLTSICT